MKTQDKELVFKALCGYLPYDVYVSTKQYSFPIMLTYLTKDKIPNVIPYLRPMTSMTKKEEKEYTKYAHFGNTLGDWTKSIDFLNEHHFDYRGLIAKGLALEAPEDMYNQPIKTKEEQIKELAELKNELLNDIK